ncbi:MAG TPA: decarboxylating 6-phosphogluconate dehydrogenase, partial [Streptosporangiaceae bacterium]
DELIATLDKPRGVWIMVPSGKITDDTVAALQSLLEKGDTIIDGGNSNYHDSIARATSSAERGIGFIDAGTSGGIWGLQVGYCLMAGGETQTVDHWRPIFETLAPPDGFLHVGPAGSGHFVKMVHNGIEYGMMAAIAEGLSIIKHADAGEHMEEIDAETTPLRDPEYYRYNIDVGEVAEVWRRGSVIGSWLMDLTADSFAKSPDLSGFTGRVSDSGEGRWTVTAAVDTGVPAPVITGALYERFESRGNGEFTGKILSALRSEFGGHAEKKA